MNLDKILSLLSLKEAELTLAIERHNNLKKKLLKEKEELNLLEKAKSVIITLGEKTQTSVKEYIEETVTLALQSVFGEEYKRFIVEYEIKRDQTEMKFLIDHNGNLVEPREDTTAGGVIDVCSFALRMVVWTLENPQSPQIMILDEPFKNISGGYLQRVTEMVKLLSSLLNIQIIMVTHINEFIEEADNAIKL